MHIQSYLITFIIYFAIIAVLSFLANRRNKQLSDYMLGGRSLSGPIAALGAGASDMGGWLLLALPGAVFMHGISEIWMPIGLSVGAYLNWLFVAPRLRTYTEIASDSLTIPAYFDHRFRDNSTFLRFLTALVVLVFFTFYAAAGFVSGGLLFKVAFHISYKSALWTSATLIMLYTAIGGFLALSWIDFFQGTLMFLALIVTPLFAYHHMAQGWHFTPQELSTIKQHIAPGYFHPFNNITAVGILSLLAWGFGYFGQPHILVRFMAAKSVKVIPQARRICMTWMMISLLGAIGTGLIGHAFFAGNLDDPESVFLQLAQTLFNPWVTGILLAAVLSAVMSTVSAQVLAASSALTADFYRRFVRPKASQKELVVMGRVTVIAIAIVAILLASNPDGNILQLVSYAWGGLAASFGPLIILSLFWKRTTRKGAIAGILTGAITIVIWKNVIATLGGWFGIYEIIPGFILASIVIIVVSLMDKPPCQEIEHEFEQAKEQAQT